MANPKHLFLTLVRRNIEQHFTAEQQELWQSTKEEFNALPKYKNGRINWEKCENADQMVLDLTQRMIRLVEMFEHFPDPKFEDWKVCAENVYTNSKLMLNELCYFREASTELIQTLLAWENIKNARDAQEPKKRSSMPILKLHSELSSTEKNVIKRWTLPLDIFQYLLNDAQNLWLYADIFGPNYLAIETVRGMAIAKEKPGKSNPNKPFFATIAQRIVDAWDVQPQALKGEYAMQELLRFCQNICAEYGDPRFIRNANIFDTTLDTAGYKYIRHLQATFEGKSVQAIDMDHDLQ